MDTTDLPANILDPNCPSRVVFQRIGDKWASLVIQVLGDGPVRFSELRKMVNVVTPKVLTQTLRALERDGLITRTVYAQVPPRVEYELTALGESLLQPLTVSAPLGREPRAHHPGSPGRLRRSAGRGPPRLTQLSRSSGRSQL